MIWSFFILLIPLTALKEIYFLSSILELGVVSSLMILLGPFNVFMLILLHFFSEDEVKLKKISLSIIFILIVVSGSFICNDPLPFLLLLETSVLPTSLLILFLSKDQDKLASVILIMLINLRGSLPFIFYSVWALSFVRDFGLTSLNRCFSIVVIFRFLLVLCSKVPVAIFHFWLTKAHVAARACISMILARILLKLGTYGLIKFMHIFNKICLNIAKFFFPWCVILAVFFSLLIVRFVDIKMLVALSSILHISLILPILCLGNSSGNFSMILMIVGHGLVSYFFFLLVRVIYESSLSRSTHYNKSSESLYRGSFILIFSLRFLNMGVPPLVNFLREALVCSNLFSYSNCVTYIFLISIVLGVFFCIFFITKRNFGRKISFEDKTMESSFGLSFWLFLFSLIIVPLIY